MATARLVTGLVRTRDEADAAIRRIIYRGYRPEDINFIVSGETRWQRIVLESVTRVIAGAGIADTGGALGAVIAAITAAGTSVVVHSAGLVMAGPIVRLFGRPGTAGGLRGALLDMDIPDEQARDYEPGLLDGDILLGVYARTQLDAERIESILEDFTPEHGRLERAARGMLDSFI